MSKKREPKLAEEIDNPLSELPNEELVALATAGDKDAYRVLVEKYQQRVQSIAFEIVKNPADAEDLAQEAFVKAYLSLKTFKGQSGFYTWLYRITFNMAVDFKRRSVRRGGVHIEFKEGLSVNSGSANGKEGEPALSHRNQEGSLASPFDEYLRKETAQQLEQVFSELSEEHRTVMVLREVDGLPYEEIAQIVGVPKGTIMSRLHYARKVLQKALKGYAPEASAGQDFDDIEKEDQVLKSDDIDNKKVAP